MKGNIVSVLIIVVAWYVAYVFVFKAETVNDDSNVYAELTSQIKSEIVSEVPQGTMPTEDPVVLPPPPPPVVKKVVRKPVVKKAQPRVAQQSVKTSPYSIRPVKGPDIPVDALLGKLTKLSKNPELIKIDPRLTGNEQEMYLRKAPYIAFIKMFKAARADGISLQIVSALRTFYHQQYIWDNKWTGARNVDGRNLARTEPSRIGRAMVILKYSSMPGTSRHHWGTDIDINSLNNEYFEQGEGKKVYNWLVKNAAKFGYAQTYTPKDARRPRGYSEEKWHWSYMPLARNFLYQYSKKITYDHLSGFEGSDVAPRLKVIPNYVFSINPALK